MKNEELQYDSAVPPTQTVLTDILRQKCDPGQTCVCPTVHARRICVVHTWTHLCVSLKICCSNPTRSENKPQSQQTSQREESFHVLLCIEEESLWRFSLVFLSAVGAELADIELSNEDKTWHAEFSLKKPRKKAHHWGGRGESMICRSFKTSLSNSTPANGDCMWRNLKANRHSARMCKPSLTLLEGISHSEYKGIWLLSVLTGLQ